jgi:hypothetical protein
MALRGHSNTDAVERSADYPEIQLPLGMQVAASQPRRHLSDPAEARDYAQLTLRVCFPYNSRVSTSFGSPKVVQFRVRTLSPNSSASVDGKAFRASARTNRSPSENTPRAVFCANLAS